MSIFYQLLGTSSGDLGKFYWQYQFFCWCISCAPWTQSCWLVVWQYFWLWTLPQGKSRTPASGQSVTINLPGWNCHLETATDLFDRAFPSGLTSWPGIIGSTRVQSRSNAKCASAVLHGVTTLPCTWKDIYQSTWRTEWRMYETSQRKSTTLRWKSLNVIKTECDDCRGTRCLLFEWDVMQHESKQIYRWKFMLRTRNKSPDSSQIFQHVSTPEPEFKGSLFNLTSAPSIMRKVEQTSPGSISSQEWEVKMKDTNELTMIPLQWCYRSIDHNLSTKILWILPGSAAASAISMQSHISLVRR